MKNIFVLSLLFSSCAFSSEVSTCFLEQNGNGEWRIVCTGDGLQYHVVDVTNAVYVIQDCENLKYSLWSSADYIERQALLNQQKASETLDAAQSAKDIVIDVFEGVPPGEFTNTWNNLVLGINDCWYYAGNVVSASRSLKATIDDINCGSCPTNGPSGGGSGGSCCDVDLSSIIQRMTVAEQQRAAISNQISRLLIALGNITNLFYSDENEQVVYDSYDVWWYYSWRNGQKYWQIDNTYVPSSPDYVYSLADMVQSIMWNNLYGFSSINNFFHDFFTPAYASLQSPSALLYFDSAAEERDYYTYLTNFYFGMIRKDSEIPLNYRTNWFARIETLLAALVFNEGGNTNYYESSQSSISNSFQQVYDDFEYRMSGISDFSTEQMRLVSTVERSMYNNLRAFSRAFSDASLPSSVQIINVHKNAGSRSLSSDTVDVTVDVDGKLLDFIEIIRSSSTLCWVFLGLWMMFKFSVWTVKKIYVLIRYIIDFFNMVVGGK